MVKRSPSKPIPDLSKAGTSAVFADTACRHSTPTNVTMFPCPHTCIVACMSCHHTIVFHSTPVASLQQQSLSANETLVMDMPWLFAGSAVGSACTGGPLGLASCCHLHRCHCDLWSPTFHLRCKSKLSGQIVSFMCLHFAGMSQTLHLT